MKWMRFMPARTAVCTAADIECDLPAPRPPRNRQHHDRSGGGSCALRAAKTQSSAASSPSPRISSSASSGVISLMSWRNWCMRLTSRKKRSAIVVVLFHDFAFFHDFTFDDAIFLASYVIEKRADYLGRQPTRGVPRPHRSQRDTRLAYRSLVTDRAMEAWYHPSMA